jgi:sulfatase maturation enzyme AslB (radical SAM superfamily)
MGLVAQDDLIGGKHSQSYSKSDSDSESSQLRCGSWEEFCGGGCEEKCSLQEYGCEKKILCVTFEACNSVRLL